MIKPNLKYVYGPVESWRMGRSLGVDPLSNSQKICNMDCIYCQLGKTHYFSNRRKVYIYTQDIIRELCLADKEDIDCITFSGRGEPTLAKNLGQMILAVRQNRPEDIAVITNSTTMHLEAVRKDLSHADIVVAKLDACDEVSFHDVDKAMCGISFEKMIEGIRQFRGGYSGILALQIMFVKENKKYAQRIAQIARTIYADEIQINTPLRPSGAKPLDEEGINEIKSYFSGMQAVTVYERDRKETIPINEADTIRRHGNYKNFR